VIPAISVVLPIFNGARHLSRTIASILAQSHADFELIVVDDGSTDATPDLLADFAARDARLRIITQGNQGLTRALIEGCAAAHAPLIARHDCNDFSHPDRLRLMSEQIARNPSCVVVGCDVAYTGPEGEILYTTELSGRDVRGALLNADIRSIVSLPAGAAALMSADAYRRAGGYRPEFYFAQDLDLWIRMAGLGDIIITAEVLYEARLDVGDISSRYRAEQLASAELAIAFRDAGTDEERRALLRQAGAIRPAPRGAPSATEANGLYFIASCLQKRNDPRWRLYASRALRRRPLDPRSWLLFVRGVMT
jgi:glycosyltransferase involved in cell wall biosynthesis